MEHVESGRNPDIFVFSFFTFFFKSGLEGLGPPIFFAGMMTNDHLYVSETPRFVVDASADVWWSDPAKVDFSSKSMRQNLKSMRFQAQLKECFNVEQ